MTDRLLVARVTIEKYLTEDGDVVDIECSTGDGETRLDVVEAVGLCMYASAELLHSARTED